MAAPISNLANLQRTEFPIAPTERRRSTESDLAKGIGVEKPDFKNAFAEALEETAATEAISNEMAVEFAEGNPDVGIHEVIIASERANVQLRYTVTLKNKLIEAYRDLMNTQV